MLAPTRAERQGERRPWVVTMLVLAFAAAPFLQAASLAGLRVLNFAPDRPWNYVAYGLAAPYVAALLWRRHPRARFAAYVFLTHEAVRGLHFGHRDAVAVAMLLVGLLQLPAARRWAPSLRAGDLWLGSVASARREVRDRDAHRRQRRASSRDRSS